MVAPPNAKKAKLLSYFDTSQTDPVTLEHHLGWQDTTAALGSPENLGYDSPFDPPRPYYFGPYNPSGEELARAAEMFGDRLRDVRMGYFYIDIIPGKDGDSGEGGDRVTRSRTGEKYIAVRVLDHVASGGVCRALFMREKT